MKNQEWVHEVPLSLADEPRWDKMIGDWSAIPNEGMLVTRAEKSVSVGHRIEGEDDDQTDKNGLDN